MKDLPPCSSNSITSLYKANLADKCSGMSAETVFLADGNGLEGSSSPESGFSLSPTEGEAIFQ